MLVKFQETITQILYFGTPQVKAQGPTLLTQDVVWTSIQRFLNVMDVKTTLCAYWEYLT